MFVSCAPVRNDMGLGLATRGSCKPLKRVAGQGEIVPLAVRLRSIFVGDKVFVRPDGT